MKPIFEQVATAYVAPKVIRAFRWQWILYGVAAYYTVRFLNKRGIFPKQTDAILDVVDQGVEKARGVFGLPQNPQERSGSESKSADLLH